MFSLELRASRLLQNTCTTRNLRFYSKSTKRISPQFFLATTEHLSISRSIFTTHPMSNDSKTRNNSHDTRDMSHADKEQVHINRMNRPPYSLDPNKPFKPLYDGSCFCKKVKFQISRERPLDAKFCHCGGCQLLHGAPFQWAAIFHKEDVHFTEGEEQLIYWNSPEKSQEYILPCKVSCKTCRTPIMDEGRNMLLLFPTLIHFKDARHKRMFHPSCHIFYSRRAIDVPDGLPKWTEHKDDSELMPETMHEEHGSENIKL